MSNNYQKILADLQEAEALQKLKIAKEMSPGIGDWIAGQLAEGRSAVYICSVLKASVDEARFLKRPDKKETA